MTFRRFFAFCFCFLDKMKWINGCAQFHVHVSKKKHAFVACGDDILLPIYIFQSHFRLRRKNLTHRHRCLRVCVCACECLCVGVFCTVKWYIYQMALWKCAAIYKTIYLVRQREHNIFPDRTLQCIVY